ncbi:UDP-N-acetylmuramoyl-tripeptide--D-alanyl-D-alanine ligase [Alkaliphilus serpentinus]|uniref:UDP-N-acetylmuramoyl-tripeptide--D-alanyl-D-alanine ligase n=1 Tax=Alkaliphilus serpentinus TaxID=1482731 RepID=A0A833HP41_9FIRM|nr:UDP-N-acetylmuramoyl-tripeptide--D-alanyl-D-alanine ligase [Alkaliphilus serpentinus]KAB3529307.1 UDP-N-acetylmuramoyl-tripeptide--D-alanyl-D-alanine ligase [Alkaliphilus serpentinus]
MKQIKPKVPTIAITGSAGKTTTKEMIASILSTKWKIFKSEGNRNFAKSTKSHAKMIKPHHQAIVLEYGMGEGNTGKMHCSFIQPNISVITNIGSAHFGVFGNDIKLTAEKKSELIQYMKADGSLYINNDDENSKLLKTQDFKGRIYTVGINTPSDFRGINVKYSKKGMRFMVNLNGDLEDFLIPTFGYHNVVNALFAIGISHNLGFTPSEMRLGLKNYCLPSRRLMIHRLPNGLMIIDDSYSANPEATKAAIDVLVNLGKDKKRIAIIGSMLELGEFTAEGHREVGKYLADKQINKIFTYGDEAQWIRQGAMEAGFNPKNIFSFKDQDKIHRYIKRVVKPNTCILVKGSKLMEMYKTVEFIKGNYSSR